ncbi:MAG: SGNH/GDSL hydrolase family protein [Clostridia bacterium]|nr:SGNH/GDSL hydrolase family protein [Clostridia bacterium]
MELTAKKINFLGDSITEGVGTSSKANIYLNLLKEECQLAEARNYGKSGTRIARQIDVTDDPFDRDFLIRAETMADDADIVVVFGGTNDFGHGEVALGTMEDRNVHTFYGAMHTLCRFLIEKYVGKTIVFMTPLHRRSEGADTNISKHLGIAARPLIDYVRAIREVCEYYSLPVLDLYANSGISGNVPAYCEKFIPDGLHPNDAGHRVIADKLRRFLEAL